MEEKLELLMKVIMEISGLGFIPADPTRAKLFVIAAIHFVIYNQMFKSKRKYYYDLFLQIQHVHNFWQDSIIINLLCKISKS